MSPEFGPTPLTKLKDVRFGAMMPARTDYEASGMKFQPLHGMGFKPSRIYVPSGAGRVSYLGEPPALPKAWQSHLSEGSFSILRTLIGKVAALRLMWL
ncbi:hypothetical protein RRG08_016790 [Elysia crispata]|uniref:Uncharacterized protein n=1 Tax=Elysia crispata TaxID=231223 RepID=A0AAE1A0F9_9GAST|nr:hypothetical protein RRG08_016790 [Elysia crispata]